MRLLKTRPSIPYQLSTILALWRVMAILSNLMYSQHFSTDSPHPPAFARPHPLLHSRDASWFVSHTHMLARSLQMERFSMSIHSHPLHSGVFPFVRLFSYLSVLHTAR